MICSKKCCKFSSIGCKQCFEKERDLVCHESDVSAHVDTIVKSYEILKDESLHLRTCLEQLGNTVVVLEQQHKHLHEKFINLSGLIEKLKRIRAQQKSILISFVLQDETRYKLIQHDKALGEQDIALADINLKLESMEIASYTGTMVWKLTNYHAKKFSSDDRPLTSPIFFTSRYGYKMVCRLYLNGDGKGKGSHLSVFFALLKGDYDDILQWPFLKRVSFTLVDQNISGQDITYSFEPDKSSQSFQKPTQASNTAFGCPLFASHSIVESPDEMYLKRGEIYLKIVVHDKNSSK